MDDDDRVFVALDAEDNPIDAKGRRVTLRQPMGVMDAYMMACLREDRRKSVAQQIADVHADLGGGDSATARVLQDTSDLYAGEDLLPFKRTQ